MYRVPAPNDGVVKPCSSPGTAGWVCTKEWRADYSGTVTKPAVDTRQWKQEYSGTVTKPGSGNVKYSAWENNGNGGKFRYAQRFNPPAWIQPTVYEGDPVNFQEKVGYFETSASAEQTRNTIAESAGAQYDEDAGFNYYIAGSPSSSVTSEQIGTGTTYFNKTSMPLEEKLFPLGKGWTWDIPYIEIKDGEKFIHLAGGGSYPIQGDKLKGYDWEGLSVITDTSIEVGGEKSQYALVPVSGTWKQHFSSDGRLLQISDAYTNTIQFVYAMNEAYGRKLLSQVTDAIGNKIQITYSSIAVTLTKGQETVSYKKSSAQGIELLDSVTDAEGRKTTYSYQLSEAKFNLMSYDPSRAVSNPYALIHQVQHPTGAKSVYTYDSNPVERKIGESSLNQAYRVFSRVDEVPMSNGSADSYNRQTMNYFGGDFASSYNQDAALQTSISDGLTETTSYFKKDYIDADNPTQYYLEKTEIAAEGTVKTTANTYGKKVGSRTYPVAVPTSTTQSDNRTAEQVTTSTEYDDYGNVLTATDAKGNRSQYTYDSEKRLLQTSVVPTNSNSSLYSEITRNNQGDISKLVVRKNNASGEILQQSDYGFDDYGNVDVLTELNDAKSIVTKTEYSANHAFPAVQSVDVTDADGKKSTVSATSEYDAATGLLKAQTDGNKKRTSYDYDKLGRPVRATHPDGNYFSIVYDDIQNTITATNEAKSKIKTTWNALGLKVEEGVFEKGEYKKKSAFGYDGYGRMMWSDQVKGKRSGSQSEPGYDRTELTYDGWSRQTSVKNPDQSVLTMIYDEALRKVTKTDAEGYSIQETYDKLGRLQKKEEQATPNSPIQLLESYLYHPVFDQVTELKDAKQKKTTYAYDEFEQLISVTNAKTEKTTYDYDRLGNLTKIIYPDEGSSVKEKGYDELGRVIWTKDEEGRGEKLYYDGNDNLIQRIDRNNSVTTFEYDDRNRRTTVKNGAVEVDRKSVV